jgi:two-component system LytT family response regulator
MTDAPRIATVVAEDEPIARRGLVDDLSTLPEFEIVGEAKDGLEALALVERLRPALLLLDVQMPGIDGFEVLARLAGAPPAVVFVTAYDRYALKAFDVHALDYLLKPFDRERLLRALDRAKRAVAERDPQERLRDLVAATADRRGRHFVVRQRGRIVLVPYEEIDWIEARSNYVMVHRMGESLLERRTLAQTEKDLSNDGFLRIHRSALVRLGAVVAVEKLQSGDCRLRLSCGETVTPRRGYRAAFCARMQL